MSLVRFKNFILEKDSKGIEIMRVVLLEVNETLIDIKQRLLQLEINQK